MSSKIMVYQSFDFIWLQKAEDTSRMDYFYGVFFFLSFIDALNRLWREKYSKKSSTAQKHMYLDWHKIENNDYRVTLDEYQIYFSSKTVQLFKRTCFFSTRGKHKIPSSWVDFINLIILI